MQARWWDELGGSPCDGGTCADAVRSLPSFRYWAEEATSTRDGYR